MTYKPYNPSAVFVEKTIAEHPETKHILSRLPDLEPAYFDDYSQFILNHQTVDQNILPINKPLVLAFQKAEFLKFCPGTQNYICCGYQILNLVNNCDINCSYCILQGYLSSSYVIVYVNIEDMLNELEEKLNRYPDKIFRIGTGELADSLSTDHLTEYSTKLIPFFADKKNAVIELKTKSTQIDNFINLDHHGRTIISWSMNTTKIIAAEETCAPTIDERLAAAVNCQEKGFKLSFHFDPMIYYKGCEEDYHYVVKSIFKHINPENIIWISLGALRYPPHVDSIIRNNHPQSKIVYGELFPGKDGKLRYFQPIRVKMFNKIYHWIKSYGPDVFVYLCMESPEVWQKAFGWNPGNSAGLKKLMDKLC